MLTAPQIIKSPSGDELVVLSRADYDAMVAALAEAAEDVADAQTAAKILAEIGDTPPLSPAESGAVLLRNGFLRSVRKARCLTQQDVARAAGITQGALSDIESGRRNASPAVMQKLAEALGVPPGQLGLPEPGGARAPG